MMWFERENHSALSSNSIKSVKGTGAIWSPAGYLITARLDLSGSPTKETQVCLTSICH